MRKASVAVLLLALGATAASAGVESGLEHEPGIVKAMRGPSVGAGAFGTANSNCAAASCDTVWIGHSSAGPGGAFLGVGVGGKWDFDTGIAGTDSSQGWRFGSLYFRNAPATLPVADRLAFARDFGNSINDGDQNLWNARQTAGRRFVKRGVAGAWHADGMAGVKRNVSNVGEPSATPLVGAKSAWCGLREAGNTNADGLDALTGNYLNGDLVGGIDAAGVGALPELPGYLNLWDQMLYKDFTGQPSSGTVSFRLRTELSDFVDTIVNGSGWFNPFPEPELLANFVNNPADSFMVYVGSPTEVAYDTNRRWFSEVLNLGLPYQQVYSTTGFVPLDTLVNDTLVTAAYSGITAGTIRVVFRVKTNRARSDQTTGAASGFNTKTGAAMIDAVSINGGAAEGFETTAKIKARSLVNLDAGGITAAGGAWATTGRPPHQYYHVENVLASGLAYADLCGGIGAPTRICNLTGNAVIAGNHDDPNHIIPSGSPPPPTENYMIAESPTIDLAVRSAAPGTKNGQGIDQETAARNTAVLEYDFYSGHLGLDESVFYRWGIRAHGPQFIQPISGTRVWSGALYNTSIYFNPDPLCYIDQWNIGTVGATMGQIDSLKVLVSVYTQGYRFGGTNLGNPEGMYWDNVRVGLVRGGEEPALDADLWDVYQDQFPWNEAVAPGDNAGFDTTAALIRTGLNNVAPATDPGVVAGDSILAMSPFVGDGIATGVRLDLVFRIDPGPGNYVIKGNRASGLVNRDPAHPFFASYLASNGPFGTPGGHPGGIWSRHVWNSARMDSSEANIHPIVSRGIGGPASPEWMGTLHESDPKFGALGISRNRCFLVDPGGATDESNIDCSGIPPAVYGAVSGTTTEGTKILPDGWFTPGTHVEYFLRRSTIEAPGVFVTLFDTNNVFPHNDMADFDADRWLSFDVLPDMWKSTRFGGAGLACMFLVDGNDRRGAERALMGAADTLGYGKNNGAKKGWKGLGPGSDPNDPAGFVAANNGQAGLNFDLYEIRASESAEAGHPGVRLATNTGAIAGKGDKSGPSAAMLAALYSTVLHAAGDLNDKTLHDTFDSQEGADDITLYDNWVTGATAANRRGLWLAGDGIMEDATFNSDDGTFLLPFLNGRFGASLVSENYKVYTGSAATTVGFLPLAPWAHPGRVYGFNHICTILADVLLVESTVDGAAAAAQYQAIGGGTEFTSSVYRPVGGSREYRTLFDGFDLLNLRGHYANLGQIATLPETDIGRISWFDDVTTSHFQICARRGPIVSAGDLPGADGGRFANVNLGAFPNPAFAAKNVTLSFTLARSQPITVRIFNVAGREVSKIVAEGHEGPNTIKWNGTLSNGAKAAAGVYFYRIDGIEFGQGSAPSKMILLSSAQ